MISKYSSSLINLFLSWNKISFHFSCLSIKTGIWKITQDKITLNVYKITLNVYKITLNVYIIALNTYKIQLIKFITLRVIKWFGFWTNNYFSCLIIKNSLIKILRNATVLLKFQVFVIKPLWYKFYICNDNAKLMLENLFCQIN